MGNYIVSARKYRPGTFASVVGQSHITHTLRSAILLDQLAHAFLFSGPRGVGKTTCARILAKAINCEDLQQDGEPCNQCSSCQTYNDGKSLNIHELDAASNNSVDDIRNLIEQTRYVPTNGKRSVYIIDEVHMLSQAAFNAFLKTLEEPPAHVLFILATTEKHKILPTILSRCQKFDFRRIKVEDITQHLTYISDSEKVDYEPAALQQIALKADGALRDALSMYDQLVSYTQQKLSFESVLEQLNILDYDYYFRAVEAIMAQDHSNLLLTLEEIIAKGFEAKDFIVGLTSHFRDLLVCGDPKTVKLMETSDAVRQRYLDQSQALSGTLLLNAFHLCSEAEQQARYATHPRLVVELVLIKLAHLESALTVSQTPVSEKKKAPLAKGNNPLTPAATPSQTRVPKPELKPAPPAATEDSSDPQQEPTPVAVADSQPRPPEAKVPSKRRKTPKLGNKLDDMTSDLLKDAEAKKQADAQEEVKEYALNPEVKIEQAAFASALQAYVAKIKRSHQMNLASALENGRSELTHNRWVLLVENDILQQVVEQKKDLLPFLRQELAIPDLFLEVAIDATFKHPDANKPYTEEEKLQEMRKRNPSVERLQEIFKTRIIYK